MGAPVVDLSIVQGKTFEFVYRYADAELVYLPIVSMPSVMPVRLRVMEHGVPDGWPIRIEGAKSPFELNSSAEDCDSYYFATYVDPDTIELNSVGASGWKPYGGGASIVFNKPYDMTGHSARMQIRDRVGGQVLLSLSSDPLAVRDGDIEVSNALSALIVKILPVKTASLVWRSGVYDLELISPAGEVYPIAAISQVSVLPEVTK